MKVNEAITLVKECGLNIEGIKYDECEKVVLNALEKQIPKKVKDEDYLPFFKVKCPSCKGHIEAHASNLYCCRCGQALDWSE